MNRDLDMFYDANRDIIDLEIYIPHRYIRDMENPMEIYTEVEFKKRFRFGKGVVRNVLLAMVVDQKPITNRGLPVSLLIGVLLTLRFYASGSFQIVCGDLRGFNQATVSRVITRVTRRIAAQSRNYIKFPDNEENLQESQRKFRRIANFPNVTGCIGCTHVSITNPGGPYAEVFRNRKRTFSINVQAVVGPDLEIYDIVALYPGSYHDSHIFDRSSVKGKFQRRELPGYLLGDVGYPCLTYLLTPFRETRTPGEARYNRAQIKRRNTVEQFFGVFKRLFPCLSRGLGNNVSTSCYIIVACAVLYNIAVTYPEIEDLVQANDNNEIPVIPFHGRARNEQLLGYLMRANVVHNNFN